MATSNKNNPKAFDRTICFTVFREWVETIQYMAETNSQQALDAFLVLSNFCLYGEEPAVESNPWGVAWPVVSAEARRSISNRRRGFGTEDTVLTDAIKAYHIAHPEASQRAIADTLHCSLGKVNSVLRSLPPLVDTLGNGSVNGTVSGEHSGLSVPPVEQEDWAIFGAPEEVF